MFERDPAKDASNLAKHGLGFATAIRIFDGRVLTAVDDRFDYGEIRENSIGTIDGVAIIVVTHCDRAGRKRIISARMAKRQERHRHEQALRQGTES